MTDARLQEVSRPEPLDPRGPVAVFESIHAVIAAERTFRSAALACDLVPIPRGVTADCGMALLFRAADLDVARAILSNPPLVGRLGGIYIPSPEGYVLDLRSAPAEGQTDRRARGDSDPDRRTDSQP